MARSYLLEITADLAGGGYFFMVMVMLFASFQMVKSNLISFAISVTPFHGV